jgi:hypothetical protein
MPIKLSTEIQQRILDCVYRDNPQAFMTEDDYVEIARLLGKISMMSFLAAGRRPEEFPDFARELTRDYYHYIDSQQPVVPKSRIFLS